MKKFTKLGALLYFSFVGGLTFAELPQRTASDDKNQKAQVIPSRQQDSSQAVKPTLNQPFNVDYQGNILYLEEGQVIHPLCHNKANTRECMSQWSFQAVPLTTQSQGLVPANSSYYLPSFVPTEKSNEAQTKALINPKVWEKISRYSAGISDEGSIKFYKNKETGKIKRVSEDREEDGYVAYIPEDAIGLKGEKVTVVVGTHAFPSVAAEEVKKGCFVFNKTASTEADYCYVCEYLSSDYRVSQLKKHLNYVNQEAKRRSDTKLYEDSKKESYVNQVCSAETTLKKVIDNFNDEKVKCVDKDNNKCKIKESGECGVDKEGNKCRKIKGSECEVGKVYNSDEVFKSTGKKFTNISDSAVDRFEAFFEISYCASCRHSIPVELMMAMMSIESAGICNDKSPTNDWGALQINLDAKHECRGMDSKKITHIKKTTCFLNPINNLYSSINVVKEYVTWKNINPSKPKKVSLPKDIPLDQCHENSWLNLNREQRDVWRRLVSGYNGGPAYIPTLTSEDEYNWEILREKYFTNPGRDRLLTNTKSNLAHTEAILGRDIPTRHPPLIEIWHQYKLDFLEKRGGKINCPE